MENAPSAVVVKAITFISRLVELIGPEGCCLSFNGGKDSTVLLHLIRQALPDSYKKLKYVYFEQKDEFPEVEAFISDISDKYGIEMAYPEGSFKEGLDTLLKESDVKLIFLGTRRGDPHGATMSELQLTDDTWPTCIRVHPILEWTYTDVWEYLSGPSNGDLAYCPLYDEGYTSLGSMRTTIPNPQLRLPDGSYGAARTLSDDSYERCNRRHALAENGTSQ